MALLLLFTFGGIIGNTDMTSLSQSISFQMIDIFYFCNIFADIGIFLLNVLLCNTPETVSRFHIITFVIFVGYSVEIALCIDFPGAVLNGKAGAEQKADKHG